MRQIGAVLPMTLLRFALEVLSQRAIEMLRQHVEVCNELDATGTRGLDNWRTRTSIGQLDDVGHGAIRLNDG